MKSFTEHLEWQKINKLANRAANLMVELDVDVEDYISEFVESYDGELLKEGWWDNLKDKFKASRVGGAVTAAVAAGKDQAGLPKFKFDKAIAGLQALVNAVPSGVKGVKGQRDLQTVLNNLLQMLEKQRPAVDAVAPKPQEMGGFTAKDQADFRAKNAPQTSSTEAPVDLTGMEAPRPKYVPQAPINVGAGIPESTQVVEAADAEVEAADAEVEAADAEAENADAEVSEKKYDPSKESWYVDDDGNIVSNIPPESDANGFFGGW